MQVGKAVNNASAPVKSIFNAVEVVQVTRIVSTENRIGNMIRQLS